jgi:uncharacterized membrane protein
MKTFSIKQSFKSAYATLMARKALYFSATLVAGVIVIILSKISDAKSDAISSIGSIALLVFQFVITAGATQFILKDFRKENVTYNDFLPSNVVLSRYVKTVLRFLLKLLPFILVIVGSMLLLGFNLFSKPVFVIAIISTILVSVSAGILVFYIIKYYFFSYISIEKEVSPKEALDQAQELSKGNRAKIFKLMLLIGVLNFLGGVSLIGWIFTAPISMLVVAHVYKSLTGENVSMSEEVPKDAEVVAPSSPTETEQVESAS